MSNISTISKLEERYKSIISDIEKEKITYNSKNSRETIALGYYSKIIESTKAILILLKYNNLQSAIIPVFRSLLEAAIDLENIINVDGYTDYLHYLGLDNKLRLSNKEYFRNKPKDYNFSELEKKYINQKNEIEERLKKNYKNKFFRKGKINTKVSFKFKLSENMDIYDTLYWLLCTDSHNNIYSIEQAYMSMNENEELVVKPFREMNIDEIERLCDSVEIILDNAQKLMYKTLNIN